ncbi:MAG: hypothetical protein ACJAXV_000543 [Bacteroidia bacterium]|jgi:hypothetical protein|tara:strand:- start:437 stop:637 length:201 start_codon:yes stop_codon:yes gene_type:complete
MYVNIVEHKLVEKGVDSYNPWYQELPGDFPTDLDIKEQSLIDELHGPSNKSNPNCGASNARNQIKK